MNAETSEAVLQAMSPGMFANHHVPAQTNFGRVETFIVTGILDDTIGMESGFMGKYFFSDNRFPFRYRSTTGLTD